MDYSLNNKKLNLVDLTLDNIAVGTIFENPGGGTSIVMSINRNKICYKRGNSNIYLDFKDIEDVYDCFKGRTCSSTDLKKFRPTVFDSTQNGHSCNCTFIFMIFSKLELLEGGIKGKGVRGNPFHVNLFL